MNTGDDVVYDLTLKRQREFGILAAIGRVDPVEVEEGAILGQVHARLGQYDQALSALEEQVENGFISWWWVNYQWPWWDNVRSEPRFQAAMQSIQDQVAEQRQLIDQMTL